MDTYFGSGAMWATSKYDAFGNKLANPTPRMIAAIQDFSVEFSNDLKELNSSDSQDAIAIARGKRTTTGKFKFADFFGDALNTIYFGQPFEDGANLIDNGTVGHIINATHTVTVTPANSGVFKNDLGVVDAESFEQFTRVDATPSAGEYTVTDAGVYTFATADEDKTVYINYNYSISTDGQTLTATQQRMGPTPSFRLDVAITGPDGQRMILTLYKCVAGKLSISTKFDEFIQPEVEFKAQLDEKRRLFTLSFLK